MSIYREDWSGDGRGAVRCASCRARISWDGDLHKMLFLHFLHNRDCCEVAASRRLVQQTFDEKGQLRGVLRETITVFGSEPPFMIEAVDQDGERVLLFQVRQQWGRMVAGPDGMAARVARNLRRWGHCDASTISPYKPYVRYRKPPDYLPTPEEIRDACEAIQETWSPRERAMRIADGAAREAALQKLGLAHLHFPEHVVLHA